MKSVIELVELIQRDAAGARRLIDGLASDSQFPLVEDGRATFFFWDGRPTDDVLLIHWVFGLESRQSFLRVPGTDAFYLPLDLPDDARIEYKFEVVRGGERTWVHDPLNPRRAFDPFGSNSVCPMPGYTVPAWARREHGARPGRLVDLEVPSAVWGGSRRVQVYLPAEYKPRRRYPLVVCHDGSDYLKFTALNEVLDTLIHRQEVAPVIVALTDGGSRNQEYAANDRHARHLIDEVVPEVASAFSVSKDPRDQGLMGASFGAVASLHTAWSHPGRFGRLLLQSGSFAFTDIGWHDRGPLWDPVVAFVNGFRADPGRAAPRMYLSCGAFESLIYYNRSLVPLLRGAGVELRFVESRDGHNWVAWRDRLREGLSWLYPGRLWMVYD